MCAIWYLIKMASLIVRSLVCLTLACLLVFARPSAGIQCQAVLSYLMPCASYLRSKGGPVPRACCSGLKALSAAAVLTKDKRDACNCIKKYAGQATGLNFALVVSMPASCGVALAFVPSPNIKCNSLV